MFFLDFNVQTTKKTEHKIMTTEEHPYHINFSYFYNKTYKSPLKAVKLNAICIKLHKKIKI